jgi:hypothetical protein
VGDIEGRIRADRAVGVGDGTDLRVLDYCIDRRS